MASEGVGEVAKLQRHLALLRQEYVKLQHRYGELEQKYNMAASAAGHLGPDHFVSRLMHTVEELFDRDMYSDIKIKIDGRVLHGHRVILAARGGELWGEKSLAEVTELELTDIRYEVGWAMMRWVYIDRVDLPPQQDFILQLMAAAAKYKLPILLNKCEQGLLSTVTVKNCVRLFQTAEDTGARELRKYCLEMITNHWDELDTACFADMNATLLYEMFKDKTQYPLHLAIQHKREDVVFLFLIEYDSELPGKLNERNEHGTLALELALRLRLASIAETLVSHGCGLDMPDPSHDDQCLLHQAVRRGDEYAAEFLITRGAGVNETTTGTKETPLHLAASYDPSAALARLSAGTAPKTRRAPANQLQAKSPADIWPADSLAPIVDLLLKNGADPNLQDSKGSTALHRAIAARSQKVFDVLIGFDGIELEVCDKDQRTALWLALEADSQSGVKHIDQSSTDSFAARLVDCGASVDGVDVDTGLTLLHKAAASGYEAAGLFLCEHGAAPNARERHHRETPLHAAAKRGLAQLCARLLEAGGDPNAQDEYVPRPTSATEVAVTQPTTKTVTAPPASVVVDQLRPKQEDKIDVSMPRYGLGAVGSSWSSAMGGSLDGDGSMSAALNSLSLVSAATSSPVPPPDMPGNPFGEETPMSPPQASSNPFDDDCSTSTKTSREQKPRGGEEEAVLPSSNATSVDLLHMEATAERHGGLRTPLMMAIVGGFAPVVSVFLDYRPSSPRHVSLDLEVCDGDDETALGLALVLQKYQVAAMLLSSAARIDATTASGLTILHKAILRDDTGAASFLLEHGANINTRTRDNRSPLQLAIQRRLAGVVEVLCQRGADLNAVDEFGTTPLWAALMSKQNDIASTLIKFGCDPNCWTKGPDGQEQTLLHRAIAMRDEDAAAFLVRSRADVDSPRRSFGSVVGDGSSPLHLCAVAGLDRVIQCLVEESANVNATDTEGRAPIHVAISAKKAKVIALLLSHPNLNLSVRDKEGQTPFAASVSARDNDAANAIMQRNPNAAEQVDNRGRTFLHRAVEKGDVEGLVFLMSVGVNVRTPVQNPSNQSALHLAVQTGSEIICRHLLLAGCTVSDVDHHRHTPLHLAASHDQPGIAGILLDNGADANAVDDNYDNCLHIAVQHGHLSVARKLLTESDVNLEAMNLRGQSPLHILCATPKDNAAAIFDLMMEYRPDLNINLGDAEGSTPLLLAYIAGASNLCRALIRGGAHPGLRNKQAVSIFNSPVATKKLLFRLLEMLNVEPQWLDGNQCHECSQNFGLKTRKHHCRHCGRLLCAKCAHQQMPIIKYDLHKPVRLCNICHDVLSLR